MTAIGPDRPPLLVIIPSRSRPEAVGRIHDAWHDTGAWQVAEPFFVIDVDDPEFDRYQRELGARQMACRTVPRWQPMVRKLNRTAADHASDPLGPRPYLGFAGDDHIPRTIGWAQDYIGALETLGTGIVYPNDGYRGEELATTWAMTSDIVAKLGRMVPAAVEHLYCDNAVMDLGRAVGRLQYLPDVLIEHMHPAAGKATSDDQYRRVNGRRQYANDRAAYRAWRREGGLQADARAVYELLGKDAEQ